MGHVGTRTDARVLLVSGIRSGGPPSLVARIPKQPCKIGTTLTLSHSLASIRTSQGVFDGPIVGAGASAAGSDGSRWIDNRVEGQGDLGPAGEGIVEVGHATEFMSAEMTLMHAWMLALPGSLPASKRR